MRPDVGRESIEVLRDTHRQREIVSREDLETTCSNRLYGHWKSIDQLRPQFSLQCISQWTNKEDASCAACDYKFSFNPHTSYIKAGRFSEPRLG